MGFFVLSFLKMGVGCLVNMKTTERDPSVPFPLYSISAFQKRSTPFCDGQCRWFYTWLEGYREACRMFQPMGF